MQRLVTAHIQADRMHDDGLSERIEVQGGNTGHSLPGVTPSTDTLPESERTAAHNSRASASSFDRRMLQRYRAAWVRRFVGVTGGSGRLSSSPCR